MNELLRTLPSTSIRQLTIPPPFPDTSKPPSILKEVLLLTLRPTISNPLLSKSYSAQIFERVELLFRRFFSPKDPTQKVNIDSVDIVLNEEVYISFF